ncbi:MAG: nucleoside triphosphate pyrophosphohydrolase [Treponema sp.]|jgi:tetrapyrrole methylase family protein/MazG family protein|nr:nucleoside triphosphate pyrophosphohydrolase [Treponema sp.]
MVDFDLKVFTGLYGIVARLRSPEGCPWDREQTPHTLRGDLIEETFECVEAIDENDPAHIKEELGDLFLVITMLAYMHEEAGRFSVAEVLEGVSEKLIRRHPHVFGDQKVKDGAEALANWAKIKVEQEGRKPKDSILDEVSRGIPPLDRAYKLQKKAAKAGFDWPCMEGVVLKIKEELEEALEAAGSCKLLKAAGDSETARYAASQEALEEELGDLLFSVVNLCRFLKVEPSVALQRTNGKFIKRFAYMEKKIRETGREMKRENLAVMDRFWEEAKDSR